MVNRNNMGAAAVGKGFAKLFKFIFMNLIPGIFAMALSMVTNAILMAVVLARFVIMSILKTTSNAVEFVGETFLNSISFIRDTVFSVLTFIVQTIINSITFIINQFVLVWSLLVRVVAVVLGETCFMTKSLFKRALDLLKDLSLVSKAFLKGIKAMAPVVKAQTTDVKLAFTNIKDVIKAMVGSIKDSLKYIAMGDEGKIMDGIIPNVFTEVFQVLPLSLDLSKLILIGTFDISKQTLVAIMGSLKELINLKDIKLGCQGK